jgi:hypothetical protein
VCEITNGRFVEAKQEKSWLAVGPLWSNPAGRLGRQHQYVPFGCSRSAANSSLSSFGMRERPLSPALVCSMASAKVGFEG